MALSTPTDMMGYGYAQVYVDEIKKVVNKYMKIKNQHVLVIGSIMPWLETILLVSGARKVTTLEYGKIKSEVSRLETITPSELAERYMNRNLTQFDAMASFSSIEHSGLGRYGDNLNPWGDLITMARAWCLVKPGGYALVGVPSDKVDNIKYNANR